jgi:hypothetical protein
LFRSFAAISTGLTVAAGTETAGIRLYPDDAGLSLNDLDSSNIYAAKYDARRSAGIHHIRLNQT